MRILAAIAGALLGLAFVFSAVVVLFKLVDMPPPLPDSPPGHFMAALGPTGYMTFIKVLELVGGVLVAIPHTRRLGLLVLGPIVVNILAFHVFLADGKHLRDPMLIGIVVLCVFLLWADRHAWVALIRGRTPSPALAA